MGPEDDLLTPDCLSSVVEPTYLRNNTLDPPGYEMWKSTSAIIGDLARAKNGLPCPPQPFAPRSRSGLKSDSVGSVPPQPLSTAQDPCLSQISSWL